MSSSESAAESITRKERQNHQQNDYNAPIANVLVNVSLGASSVRTALQNAEKGAASSGGAPLKLKRRWLASTAAGNLNNRTSSSGYDEVTTESTSSSSISGNTAVFIPARKTRDTKDATGPPSTLQSEDPAMASRVVGISKLQSVPDGKQVYTTCLPSNNIFSLRVIDDIASKVSHLYLSTPVSFAHDLSISYDVSI